MRSYESDGPLSAEGLATGFTTELAVAGRKMRKLFDNLVRERGLTLARARVLLLLGSKRDLSQREITDALEVEQPSTVRLLDGMEAGGLITRCAVGNDRRVKRIALTASGEAQLHEIEVVLRRIRMLLLAGIESEDLAIALTVLQAVVRNAEAAPALYEAECRVAAE